MLPPSNRRPLLFVGLAVGITFLLFLAHRFDVGGVATSAPWSGSITVDKGGKQAFVSADARRRIARLKNECAKEDPFEKLYSRANLRMTRGYEGSLARLERFIHKVLRGERVKVGVIGGSVTKGHGVQTSERWTEKLSEFLGDFYSPSSEIEVINGAQPATGSDYYSYCFKLHVPDDVDLVLVELGINDVGNPEDLRTMEDLLRGLLDLEVQPAVVLLEVLGFSGAGMGGGGGRYHLPIAQYYDVPVVNQRHPTASHFGRFPDIMHHYFDIDGWGNTDMRHLNARGHRDAANIIASLLRDTTCSVVAGDAHPAEPSSFVVEKLAHATYDEQLSRIYDDVPSALHELEYGWGEEQKTWSERIEVEVKPKTDDSEAEKERITVRRPGMWERPVEHGLVPRMEFLAGWNPDPNYRRATSRPTCFSTKAVEPKFNLTPTAAEGFQWWRHPDHNDKPYIIATEPGARVEFEIETHAGTIKMYYLKSERMSLGKLRCWVDGGERNGEDGVLLNGYWKRDWLNIGQYTTLAEHLSPGLHRVNCLNLNETDTADGGHDFRIISLVSS